MAASQDYMTRHALLCPIWLSLCQHFPAHVYFVHEAWTYLIAENDFLHNFLKLSDILISYTWQFQLLHHWWPCILQHEKCNFVHSNIIPEILTPAEWLILLTSGRRCSKKGNWFYFRRYILLVIDITKQKMSQKIWQSVTFRSYGAIIYDWH